MPMMYMHADTAPQMANVHHSGLSRQRTLWSATRYHLSPMLVQFHSPSVFCASGAYETRMRSSSTCSTRVLNDRSFHWILPRAHSWLLLGSSACGSRGMQSHRRCSASTGSVSGTAEKRSHTRSFVVVCRVRNRAVFTLAVSSEPPARRCASARKEPPSVLRTRSGASRPCVTICCVRSESEPSTASPAAILAADADARGPDGASRTTTRLRVHSSPYSSSYLRSSPRMYLRRHE
mmetsp:Transcript_15932/g.55486  ORF Transcript_15932/g.55486 Transcript_15932/m.55486 type:complete len:235 (-) Transcript_15932:16174-16878(-)